MDQVFENGYIDAAAWRMGCHGYKRWLQSRVRAQSRCRFVDVDMRVNVPQGKSAGHAMSGNAHAA